MGFIYEELSKFAPVFYEDMEREKDGSIKIDDTNIVYNLEGMFELTDNKVRKDIPLLVDIWYLKKDIYDVEDMVYEIDKEINEYIFRSKGLVFRIERSSNYVMNIPDDSENVRRKRINYVVKYYKY